VDTAAIYYQGAGWNKNSILKVCVMHNLISGDAALNLWLVGFIAVSVIMVIAGIATGYFKARKIQPKGFKWKQFRFEAMIAVISIAISGPFITWLTFKWRAMGVITFHHEPATWYVIAFEYALYFIGFDTWFYWLHRWMHQEPMYKWIHKLHHKSTSTNFLTTLSVNPLESFINGGFVPIFTALMTVHDETMLLIGPTNIIMGLYVHAGYEVFPKWWNKTWLTKWFITATFHDHHHKYFNANYGGYTTIWDRICGTVHKKFEPDFVKIKERPIIRPGAQSEAAAAE